MRSIMRKTKGVSLSMLSGVGADVASFRCGWSRGLGHGAQASRAAGQPVQRQVQKHGVLEARPGKIGTPPDLGHWAPSLTKEPY